MPPPDNIGRCYNLAKPFRTLLEELRAQSGTRYAPNVVALFEDERFCQQLAENTDAERKRVYLQVYHAGSEENKYHKQKEPLGLTSPVSTGK